MLVYQRAPLGEDRPREPLRLTLAASRSLGSMVRGDVRAIRLLGTGFAAPETEPIDPALIEARHRLVEDDSLGALASLARASAMTPADRLLEVVARARLGDLAPAGRVLKELLTDESNALDPPLRASLRTAPEVVGALLRAAVGPAEARARFADAWWHPVVADRLPASFTAAWAGLAERDLDTDSFQTLFVHAQAAAGSGHYEAAQRSFRAALRALDDPRRRDDIASVEAMRLSILLELAALALMLGDEQAARSELRPYVEGPDADPAIMEHVRARVDLRALWDLIPD